MLPKHLGMRWQSGQAMIQVDPTFLMTMRGQEWIRRTAAHGSSSVWCSYSYVTAACRPEGCCFDIYRSGIGQWERRRYLPPDIAAVLRPVRREARAPLPLQLDHLAYDDADILLDIWCGVLDGHWLVARRPSTFDALVQAGVTLIVRGSGEYLRAFASATADLGSALAGALDRRTRFLASALTETNNTPTLSVYDSGRAGYR